MIEFAGLNAAEERLPMLGRGLQHNTVRLNGIPDQDDPVLLRYFNALPGRAEAGLAPGRLHWPPGLE
jgi:hypothetical protein